MDESFFPIIWREDGYRSPFLDPYLRREVGWAGARPVQSNA
jgi:phytanoyl-CoA hydroxylase